jgi:crotonobetainyl-CoA:carnitine CoA-transferase CaiB-like acyl-CoA transferase
VATWATALSVGNALVLGEVAEQPPHDSPMNMPVNPLIGDYKTKDNRWVTLTMLQPGRYWADTCRHLGLDHLIEDPRFDSAEKLMANADEAGAYLGEVFRTKTLAEGHERFLASSPVQFDEEPLQLRRAPQFAEHTDEIVTELGRDEEALINLKIAGAIT